MQGKKKTYTEWNGFGKWLVAAAEDTVIDIVPTAKPVKF